MNSKYPYQPLDFSGLKTVAIQTRGGKVRVEHFAKPFQKGAGVASLIDSLPSILAADSFRAVIDAIAAAREQKRAILWGLGGHVIKCGLAPVLIDLMQRGYASGFVSMARLRFTISKSGLPATPARMSRRFCPTEVSERRKRPAAK